MHTRELKRLARAYRDPVTLGILAVGVIGGGLLASSMADSGEAPAPPKIEPVTPMPTADSAEVDRARTRSLAQQRARRGRMSTILSDPGLSDQPLGGG